MWGHLVPLSPFAPSEPNGDIDDTRRCQCSDSAMKPMGIPGSFGREDLLRPFARACPICSCRHRGKTSNAASPNAKAKNGSDMPPLCDVCRSIQAVAKFVPRKDFLHFTNKDDSSGNGALLVSIPRSASRLVTVRSSRGDPRQLNDRGNAREVEVSKGDIISLLWYNSRSQGATGSSTALAPLVRYRLVRTTEEASAGTGIDNNDLVRNDVNVDLLIETERDAKTVENGNDQAKRADGGDNVADGTAKDRNDGDATRQKIVCNNVGEAEHDEDNAAAHDTGKENEDKVSAQQKIARDDGEDSSSSSSDDEHLWNAGGFLKAGVKKEEKVARRNYFRDVRAKYGDDRPVGRKRKKLSRDGTSSNRPSQPSANCKEDASSTSVGGGSKTEEESESAPLTLPSQFLASYPRSFSFDSAGKSPSQPLKGSMRGSAQAHLSTPQKSNQSCKRTYDKIDPTDLAKEATKTPKKSNISADNNASVPMSSLSYDQLVQLQKDSKSVAPAGHPSVRHSVLSLTVALTSNASSWDANFLRDCNAGGGANGGTNPSVGENPRRDTEQRWMPRLLQGSRVKLHEKDNINTKHSY